MKTKSFIAILLAGLSYGLVGCQGSSETPPKPALTQTDYDKMSPSAKEGYERGMAAQNAARARMNKPALPVLGGNGQ